MTAPVDDAVQVRSWWPLSPKIRRFDPDPVQSARSRSSSCAGRCRDGHQWTRVGEHRELTDDSPCPVQVLLGGGNATDAAFKIRERARNLRARVFEAILELHVRGINRWSVGATEACCHQLQFRSNLRAQGAGARHITNRQGVSSGLALQCQVVKVPRSRTIPCHIRSLVSAARHQRDRQQHDRHRRKPAKGAASRLLPLISIQRSVHGFRTFHESVDCQYRGQDLELKVQDPVPRHGSS